MYINDTFKQLLFTLLDPAISWLVGLTDPLWGPKLRKAERRKKVVQNSHPVDGSRNPIPNQFERREVGSLSPLFTGLYIYIPGGWGHGISEPAVFENI